MSVIVLTGPNDYARLTALRSSVADFIVRHGDMTLERLDAGSLDVEGVIAVVANTSLFAEEKMVILTNLSANKSLSTDIEKVIDSLSDTTTLVIEESKFDKRLSLYKCLKKKADFKEFAELNESQLSGWLVSESIKRGGKITQVEARYLVERLGIDQMTLSSELDKLICYDPIITKESIGALVASTPSGDVFELLEAAFNGNKQRAAALYGAQRLRQVEPQYIMGMIAWQLHIMAVVKFNQRHGVEWVARQTKISPYALNKTMKLVAGLSGDDIAFLIKSALELDVRLKSESIDADDAVQLFLLSIDRD